MFFEIKEVKVISKNKQTKNNILYDYKVRNPPPKKGKKKSSLSKNFEVRVKKSLLVSELFL